LKNTKSIVGTSNVHLAMTHNIPCLGTMAHEFLSGHLGLVGDIKDAQKIALTVWLKEYGEKLAVALTDTFTTDAFFRDMDEGLTHVYTGLRHDSGCPFEFGEKALAHYKKFNIDTRTKKLVFSDGLDLELATLGSLVR
jgi:nicotinate phosphoribosyltransferase